MKKTAVIYDDQQTMPCASEKRASLISFRLVPFGLVSVLEDAIRSDGVHGDDFGVGIIDRGEILELFT